jgi:cbb3-type cytochrome oxidase subunit 3
MLIIALIIALVLFIGIPIGISFVIYRWIKKKEFNKTARIFALAPILIAGYFIYDAIYPGEEFYKTDFKEVTEMEFPKNGEIIYKAASFPDNFGDYTSSCLIELDSENLKELEKRLTEIGFVKKENKMITDQLDYIESKKGDKKYVTQYFKEKENGKEYFVGFLDDKKSVIVTRVSW